MKMLKKLFSAFLILVLAFGRIGFAAEGDSNVTNLVASGDITAGGSLMFNATLLAAGRVGGASSMASSSTNIGAGGLSYTVYNKFIGGGGGLDGIGVGTVLPAGTAGQVVTFIISGVQSGGTWKITPTTATGFISITFDAKGDQATLMYVNSTIGWIILGGLSLTVTQN